MLFFLLTVWTGIWEAVSWCTVAVVSLGTGVVASILGVKLLVVMEEEMTIVNMLMVVVLG